MVGDAEGFEEDGWWERVSILMSYLRLCWRVDGEGSRERTLVVLNNIYLLNKELIYASSTYCYIQAYPGEGGHCLDGDGTVWEVLSVMLRLWGSVL